MIPKVIHYCWFGGNPLPELAEKCIASWHKYCSDYEIKVWNETNFDLNSCAYVREAYQAKKWAFITDYVRLYALVTEGGIYMDTDVEVLKPLDRFLEESAFSGFESIDFIPTGIMGAEKEHPLLMKMLCDYENRHFIKNDGSLDQTTNCVTITNLFVQNGLELNNQKQTVDGFTLYPKEYFCPKSHDTGKIEITNNTYTIHHFAGSWHTEEEVKIHQIEIKMREYFGEGLGKNIGRLMTFPLKIENQLKQKGVLGTLRFCVQKITRN